MKCLCICQAILIEDRKKQIYLITINKKLLIKEMCFSMPNFKQSIFFKLMLLHLIPRFFARDGVTRLFSPVIRVNIS